MKRDDQLMQEKDQLMKRLDQLTVWRVWGGPTSTWRLSPTGQFRACIFKRLWSPGIDSKEWIPSAYVAWRAGAITLGPYSYSVPSPNRFFKNSSSLAIHVSYFWKTFHTKRDKRMQYFIGMTPVPEIINLVFANTSPKRSFSMTEYEPSGLVFTKTLVYKFGHWQLKKL
jgi:hypothetical protein